MFKKYMDHMFSENENENTLLLTQKVSFNNVDSYIS